MLDLKNTLNQLFKGETLSYEAAKTVLTNITKAEYNHAQVASFLTVYNVRPISLEELSGFKNAMLDLCISLDFNGERTMDLCGTGGDGKNTFNISTLSSLVAAAAGVKVTKHGNKSVSSNCGSSNVLEHLGVQFSKDESLLQKQLEANNICFLHAPLFHPALKNVGKVRTDLAVKTFLNMLGPLVNPARPQVQLTGVFSAEVARLYNYNLQSEGIGYSVIHDLSGYDEISLTGPVKVFNTEGEFILHPSDFGLETGTAQSIYGGEDVASSAAIFSNILEGKGTKAQNNVVAANAGLGIATYKHVTLKQGVEEAMEAIQSKSALDILNATIQMQ